MSTPVVTVPADTPVSLFLNDYVLKHKHTHFPVVGADGSISVVHLSTAASTPHNIQHRLLVKDIAQTLQQADIKAVSPTQSVSSVLPHVLKVHVSLNLTSLDKAIFLMLGWIVFLVCLHQSGRVLVVEPRGGQLVGVLSAADVAFAMSIGIRQMEAEGEAVVSVVQISDDDPSTRLTVGPEIRQENYGSLV